LTVYKSVTCLLAYSLDWLMLEFDTDGG